MSACGPMTARRNASSIKIGDAPQGTAWWSTEYDCEFFSKAGLNVDKYLPAERRTPATPRSFKKGFVHQQDFQNLEKQFSDATAKAEKLKSHLSATQNQLRGWQGDESALLQAFSQEHELLDQTGRQMMQAASSLQVLLEAVERNRTLMSVISEVHGLPQRNPKDKEEQVGKFVNDIRDIPRTIENTETNEEVKDTNGLQHGDWADDDRVWMKARLEKMESDLSGLIETIKHLVPTQKTAPVSVAEAAPARPRRQFVERIESYPMHKSRYAKTISWRPWT